MWLTAPKGATPVNQTSATKIDNPKAPSHTEKVKKYYYKI